MCLSPRALCEASRAFAILLEASRRFWALGVRMQRRACMVPRVPCRVQHGRPFGGRGRLCACLVGWASCHMQLPMNMGYLGGIVPNACLMVVPMGCASIQAHGVVVGTCHNMHAGLMGCLLWAHANVMGMCRWHMQAVTWPCWAAVRVCLAPPWLCFESLIARFGVKSGVISRNMTLSRLSKSSVDL